MSNRELITVIVPIYNVEPYLRKCIDSILVQTYQHLEIILVNDGSTDNCGIICDEYAPKDARIKVIHQKNKGVSAARNIGLSQAQGTYIGFIDPDDWISPDMYQCLYNELINREADMAACGIYIATDKEIYSQKLQLTEYVEEFTSKEAILSAGKQHQIKNGPCDKLYKRHLFDQIKFPEGRFFEDTYIIVDILSRCRKIVYVTAPHYYYYQREDSTCHTYSAKNLEDQLDAHFIKSKKIKQYYPELKNFADSLHIMACTAIYVSVTNNISDTEEKNQLCCLIRNNLQQYSLQQLVSIRWKRWPAALLIKYLPQGFRCYAILETLVRKILIRDQVNIIKFHRSTSQSKNISYK
ncbi:glycosyltransferase [Bacteroides sp.]|uniref:glycosyltransferase family 2 protein n=1 Tax=Bacteroides sp. TaxID=29523 RepID=UPI00262AB712|nr:glycosyltransferase [Bacteroides sp.]